MNAKSTSDMIKSSVLSQRLSEAKLRLARLDGAYLSDQSSHAAHAQKLSLAKGRLALAEEVSTVFNALQKRAHQRSVGAFERLLTAIMTDVMPEEGSVRLIPEYKSNATWLDVALEKNGNLEDVVDANGGGATAVVVTGLRFAALSRTQKSQNRKLLVLDESAAWLPLSRVTPFVNVLAQVSEQTHTQVLFISHHPPELFSDLVNVVTFERGEDDEVNVNPVLPLKRDWQDDASPGIRKIELINFRRHKHTVVPCYPGATAYMGDSNLGKSTAVSRSLKAVAYGESDDTVIRHGQDEAKVIIYIEGDERIEWTRNRKKNPVYRHYRGGTLVAEGKQKNRNEAPEWVADVLKIRKVDDLDIQIGNQKQPIFLLNEPAPRRAQILSAGRESSHYLTLIKKYEETKASDRDTVKTSELELGRLNLRLAFMKKVPHLQGELESMLSTSDEVIGKWSLEEKQEEVLKKLEALTDSLKKVEKESSVLRGLPGALPELHDVTAHESVLQRLERHSRFGGIKAPPEVPGVPVLQDVYPLYATVSRLERLSRLSHVGLPPVVPALPEVKELETISMLGAKIAKHAKSIQILSALPTIPPVPTVQPEGELATLLKQLEARQNQTANLQLEEAVLEKEYAEIKAKYGGLCPLCGGTLETNAEKTHVH